MALCKTAVTPLLTHWSYCSFALNHRYCVVSNSWGDISYIKTNPKKSSRIAKYLTGPAASPFLMSNIFEMLALTPLTLCAKLVMVFLWQHWLPLCAGRNTENSWAEISLFKLGITLCNDTHYTRQWKNKENYIPKITVIIIRLIFIMEIPIAGRTIFILRRRPVVYYSPISNPLWHITQFTELPSSL